MPGSDDRRAWLVFRVRQRLIKPPRPAARRAAVPLLIQGGDSSLFSSNLAPPGGMKNSTGLCWIPAGLRSVGVRFCRRSDDVPG